MPERKCSICEYNFCVEKHHPDGKKAVEIIWDWRTNKKHYFDKYDKEQMRQYRELGDIILKLDESEGCRRHSAWGEDIHINPDVWIYLCPSCHVLYHKYSMTIDEIKEKHRLENEFHDDLYSYMAYELGTRKMKEYIEWILEHQRYEAKAKKRIGKVCSCGKKHYKLGPIFSCMMREKVEAGEEPQ